MEKIIIDVMMLFGGINNFWIATEHKDNTYVELPEIIRNDHFVSLILDGILWLFIVFVALFFVLFVYKSSNAIRKVVRKSIDKYLPAFVCIVWLMGFITYCVGMHVPVENNFFSVVPMAMIHATEMFFSISDISAIHQDCYNSMWFMALYNVSHFLAVLLSLVYIIRQFGYNIIAKVRFLWTSLTSSGLNDIYVFWGVNDASYLLAQSIENHYKGAEYMNKYHMVFVRTIDRNDDDVAQLGISRIFRYFNVKNRELDKLRDIINSSITSSSKSLSRLELGEGPVDVLESDLGLNSLARLVKKQNKECHVHFFFLDEEQDTNVQATINLLKDSLVRDRKVTIYCQARKSAKTQWLEYYNYCHQEENTEVKVIDAAYLSIASLKQDVNCHPVQHVRFNTKTAFAETAFNSLILGFGETGVEALRFLYEFGAFVKSDGTKSEFHCTVFDNNMDSLKAHFLVQNPSIRDDGEIDMCSGQINSDAYWEKLKSIIPTLDYIVVCLGNDELTLDTVANLCEMAIRWREEIKLSDKDDRYGMLDIYVRSYDNDKYKQLKKICDEINIKYKNFGISVIPFGQINSIFSYDIIVADKILRDAKTYNLEYKKHDPNEIGYDKDEETAWFEGLGMQKNKTITDVMEIKRKFDSNVSNSLHASTKIHILKNICGADIEKDVSDELKVVLSMVEHERWNASMRLLGYQWTSGKKNPDKKLSPLLCSWDKLDNGNQCYDTAVVNTTIALEKSN